MQYKTPFGLDRSALKHRIILQIGAAQGQIDLVEQVLQLDGRWAC